MVPVQLLEKYCRPDQYREIIPDLNIGKPNPVTHPEMLLNDPEKSYQYYKDRQNFTRQLEKNLETCNQKIMKSNQIKDCTPNFIKKENEAREKAEILIKIDF